MTTSNTQVSLSDVNTELGLSSTASINLNSTTVRRLAEQVSGAVTMQNLRNRTWLKNFQGSQSSAGCYSAQGGFSVDRLASTGDLWLTMGVWPTDPPNCQTCNWLWLNNGGTGSTDAFNSYRTANNIRPYWTMVWSINITNMAINEIVETRAPNWPYTLVSYTYRVRRADTNTITITPYSSPWGTGDTGTSISINNWWNNVAAMGGGGTSQVQTGVDAEGQPIYETQYNPGTIGYTWASPGY